MIKKSTIPTILGIIVLVVGAFAGVFFLRNSTVFKIGADAAATPKNIRVGNITDTSATLSWTTDKASINFLVWGTSAGSVNKTQNEDTTGQKYFTHSITLTGLTTNTTYFYKINSDGTMFDNSNAPWQFKTGPSLGEPGGSILISGSVINASGTPEKKALVYADIGGYLFTTQASDTGNYVFQIGSARTADLQESVQVDPSKTVIQISVQATPSGIASAQIFPQSANPVPPIIIGQTYDFRNEPVNNQGIIPSADLNLPQDAVKESKFDITVPNETAKPTSVILESLSEGETVTSTQPQFFGKGPGGTEITITVNSEEEITDNVQIPQNGSWSYEVPTDLAPGNHSITISWIDVSGITRFLTRNFVVKAGEVPAFTASESGSTPIPTPTLSASATPKASITPTPTGTPESTATALPVPVSGDLTPTLLLSIMGLVVLTFSFIVWKTAEN
jgi:hypothetical protein